MRDISHHFDFVALKNGTPNISKVYGAFLAEAAAHCFKLKKHPSPVPLLLTGDLPNSGILDWGEVKELHDGTYTDLQEATEYGACGVALVVALQLTGLPCVERSAKGTGIDYWLGDDRSGPGIFQRSARLEVSGILDGDEAKIAARLNSKIVQTNLSDESRLPAYIAIVEFSTPETRFVKKVRQE
jgi:hypothetical protein